MWRTLMMHAHWNSETNFLAQRRYLRTYRAVHRDLRAARRFLGRCADVPLQDECFAQLSAYSVGVREVQNALRPQYVGCMSRTLS